MDFSETEEQALLREAVGRLAAGFGRAYYTERARARQPQTELWEAAAKAGYVGVCLPQEYGGGGMGVAELAIVAEELGARGCPLMLLMVSPAICGTIIARFGTPEQRRRWLPGLASGELKMSFAITEPDAGSNSHRLATVATRDRGDWLLRGSKYHISGVNEAQAILLVARSGSDPATGRGRLSLFVVDTDAAGLTATPIPMDVQVPEQQFTLFLDDVRVPAERLLGSEGDGLRQVFLGLNPERVIGGAGTLGVARNALTRAAEYARGRQVWRAPIGSHQAIAHPLAAAKIEVELAWLATQKAAWSYDRGLPQAGEWANMAKYAAAEAALHAVDAAVQAHGGNAFASEYGLAAMWAGVRVLRTAPVSREMILNHIAERSLGLPRSY